MNYICVSLSVCVCARVCICACAWVCCNGMMLLVIFLISIHSPQHKLKMAGRYVAIIVVSNTVLNIKCKYICFLCFIRGWCMVRNEVALSKIINLWWFITVDGGAREFCIGAQ